MQGTVTTEITRQAMYV